MKTISPLHIRLSVVVMLSIGILAGCVSLQLPQMVSNEANHDVKQFRPVQGKSRVYFFHGPVRTCKAGDCIDQKIDFPFAVYVDGIQMGTLVSRANYLRADIAPGKHRIQWKYVADSPEGEQGDMEISMESGQAYFVRVRKDNNLDVKPIAVGSAAIPSTGQLENVGVAGQAELADKTLVVVEQDAIQRLSGRTAESSSTQKGSVSAPSSPTSIGGKLAELKDMFDHNLITKDEYDSKRKQFLDTWK